MIEHANHRPGLLSSSSALPAPALFVQRKCACGSSMSSLTGECAECMSERSLQAKRDVGAANDPLEREADRIATEVLAQPAYGNAGGAYPPVPRLSRPASGQLRAAAPASVEQAFASPGRPLEPALRRDMEQRFGHDFSRIRIYSGASAERSAAELNAHAYTAGDHIVFGAGRYQPQSGDGRALIAHELAHTIQQSSAGTSATVQRQPASRDEIEMPAMYVGAVNKPVDVLEAIVHIMAGNQVAGDYGPAGENLMHPQYYIQVKQNITKKEYIELLWEWFHITNGTVTDKKGVQSIVQGSMARERIPRAAAETESIIAKVGAKEGAPWVKRYKAKVEEFKRRAVREEVGEMIDAGVAKERAPKSNIAALSADEQVKGVAVKATDMLQQLEAQFRRALGGEGADRVNERVNERIRKFVHRPQLREYLRQTFKGNLFADAPEPQVRVLESKMSLPDAFIWLKGGLDAASAILTLTDPAARRKLLEARSSYFGKVAQGLEINQLLWKFVSGAVAIGGASTYGLARALGKADLAAQVLDVSTKWAGRISGAFFVVGTLHGVAVLLDPNATSNEKAAAAVEATSSALGFASFASRWTPKLAIAGRWGNPIGISLTLNFWQFSKLADLRAGAAVGLTRLDWVSCFKATKGAAQETQDWMRRLAVTNVLISQETDSARVDELRKDAEIYREELMDRHIRPYLAARLRPDKAKGDPDDCGPALGDRFKPMARVLDSTAKSDDAALGAAAMFLNISFEALKDWDKIVASTIK